MCSHAERKLEDLCGEVVELTMECGWSPDRLKSEIIQAWEEVLQRQAQEQREQVRRSFG